MGYFPVSYNSRVVIYERKMFIRLATDLLCERVAPAEKHGPGGEADQLLVLLANGLLRNRISELNRTQISVKKGTNLSD